MRTRGRGREVERVIRWESFDIVLRESRRTPFREELLGGHGDKPQTALQKIRLVQAHGWPQARLELKDKRGKNLIDRADDQEPPIWILTCKPSCWRLYFHVYSSTWRIVYLYAKCKQQQSRDPRDSAIARGRLARLQPGGDGIAPFPLP